MADARAFIALGMAPELAKEVARQIETAAGGTAASVTFDPTDAPGITATNVQAAIEELATIVDDA